MKIDNYLHFATVDFCVMSATGWGRSAPPGAPGMSALTITPPPPSPNPEMQSVLKERNFFLSTPLASDFLFRSI